ncbi:MAG: aldehyde ferredoxin oxidoreductase N-terminal domain-containing protein, partial [Planctomycetota bacterium]
MTILRGKRLRVDLSSGRITREETPAGIGARSWGSVTLFEELKPGIDPLGPDNVLCIAAGPLTGSALIGSCRFIASAKSPLTGYHGDSGARGFFGPELNWSGHDQLLFTGVSDRWVYLYLDNDTAELRDASHLAGKDITETTLELREELLDPDLQVATIGPAGENLVRFAIIACNLTRACGRTGMGAVMGSKKLKAIAVRGTGEVRPADPERFAKACAKLQANIEGHRQFESRRRHGTIRIMDTLGEVGLLPAYHYTSVRFAGLEKINAEALRRKHIVKSKAC